MTVSRAMRDQPDVSGATRDLVIECAEELDYRPNRWARSLVSNKTDVVGIILPDIAHSYFSQITLGVEEILEKAGYDLFLCHSRGEYDREQREIDTLLGCRVDGLIIASTEDFRSAEPLEKLTRQAVPFVLIDRIFENLEARSVCVDDHEVGRLAALHLLDLGHRKLGYLSEPRISPGIMRARGFLDAVRAANLEPPREETMTGSETTAGGEQAMLRLCSSDDRPTGVAAFNDRAALGAVAACHDKGIAVPEQISVVGAGAIEVEGHPDPYLTTIGWPRVELGRMAARALLSAIKPSANGAERVQVLQPELLARRSTAAPPV